MRVQVHAQAGARVGVRPAGWEGGLAGWVDVGGQAGWVAGAGWLGGWVPGGVAGWVAGSLSGSHLQPNVAV